MDDIILLVNNRISIDIHLYKITLMEKEPNIYPKGV